MKPGDTLMYRRLAMGLKGRGSKLDRGFNALGPGLNNSSDGLAVDRANMIERCGSDRGMSPDIGTNLSNRHRLLRTCQWTNDVEPLFDGLDDTQRCHRRGLRICRGGRVLEDKTGASRSALDLNLVGVALDVRVCNDSHLQRVHSANRQCYGQRDVQILWK